jgi:hypothetical protein
VRATQQLYAANGQDVDSELALFEADHGDRRRRCSSAAAPTPRARLGARAGRLRLGAARGPGRSAEALPIARASARLGLRSRPVAYHLGAIEAAGRRSGRSAGCAARALDLNPTFTPCTRLAPRRCSSGWTDEAPPAPAVLLGAVALAVVPAAPAAAHPLGNFTVNTADQLS